MNPCEQALGISGKKELPFNRKRTPAEPGSGRSSHMLQSLRGWSEGEEREGINIETKTLYSKINWMLQKPLSSFLLSCLSSFPSKATPFFFLSKPLLVGCHLDSIKHECSFLTSKGEVPKTCILSEDHKMATVVEAKTIQVLYKFIWKLPFWPLQTLSSWFYGLSHLFWVIFNPKLSLFQKSC